MELTRKTRKQFVFVDTYIVAFTCKLLFEFSIWARIYFRGPLISSFVLFCFLPDGEKLEIKDPRN